jgi:hypothetical protein
MQIELNARNVLRMIDRLFERSQVVSKSDVIVAARFADLGRDGLRAAERIPAGYYTKAELRDALATAVLSPAEGRLTPDGGGGVWWVPAPSDRRWSAG